MDVVGHYGQAGDPPIVHLGAIVEQLSDRGRYFTSQNPTAVLRNPDQMVGQTIPRMRPVVMMLAFFHNPSIPDCFRRDKTLSLLQGALQPRAEARGFRHYSKKIIGISDDYGAYRAVEQFLAHALCWAHPNRKLRDLAESKTLPAVTKAHCDKVYRQFNTLYKEVNKLWAADVSQTERDKQRKVLEARFKTIAKPHSKDPPELATYKDSLRSNIEAYFVCLQYPNIPPDNNKAERALRHLVIKRKACGGSKTQKGADVLSVLYSVLLSLHWRNPADYFSEYDKLLEMAG